MHTPSLTLFLMLFITGLFAQTPHPILRYLNADLIDDEVRLSWVITGGNTCSGIRIQRSADGFFFETIGEIDGICGSPDVDIPYVFLDAKPLPIRKIITASNWAHKAIQLRFPSNLSL